MFKAVSLSSESFMTIAFNNPLPLTILAIPLVLMYSLISDLKSFPKDSAFSTNPSSLTTSKAAIATLQPKGFPP